MRVCDDVCVCVLSHMGPRMSHIGISMSHMVFTTMDSRAGVLKEPYRA